VVRSRLSLSTFVAGLIAAVLACAAVAILADGAGAEPAAPAHRYVPLELPPIRAQTEPGDEIAALAAVEVALTQASDGATYFWQRGNGRLAGAIRMRSTFRDVDGRICRHLEMQMRLGDYVRKTEGVACRGADRVWLLEG